MSAPKYVETLVLPIKTIVRMIQNGDPEGDYYEAFDCGKLITEHEMQRRFIYQTHETRDSFGNLCNASSALISNVLLGNLSLPAITLWRSPDMESNTYYVQDGKQRITTFLRYKEGDAGITPQLEYNGKSVSYDSLDKVQKADFNNFTVVCNVFEGTEEQQSFNFEQINTHGAPLSEYEALCASRPGSFVNEFEEYIATNRNDFIEDPEAPAHRGSQLLGLLAIALNEDHVQDMNCHATFTHKLRRELDLARHTRFNPTLNNFANMFEVYKTLIELNSGIKADRVLIQLSWKVATSYPGQENILRDWIILNKKRDNLLSNIDKWTYNEWMEFLPRIMAGKYVDPNTDLKYFKKDVLERDGIWDEDRHKIIQVCACCGKELTEKEYQFDHIIPKKLGGPTRLENLRLTCPTCNKEKSSKLYKTLIGKYHLAKMMIDCNVDALYDKEPEDGRV